MGLEAERGESRAIRRAERIIESHMLLKNRQPFPAAVTWFDHQPILLRTTFKRHIFARKEVKETRIEPVAFRPTYGMSSRAKSGSTPLNVEACLALCPSGGLMRRSDKGWTSIENGDVTDNELRWLRIGVQGNEDLLLREIHRG